MAYQAMRYGEKWPMIAQAWDKMVIKKDRVSEIQHEAQKLLNNKERYAVIQTAVGVPWYMVAALHLREASGNFNTYLGNGEPLDRTTRLVPKGRGPFDSWEAGAIDAMKLQKFDKIIDWNIEKILFQSVLYNGLGYEMRKLPSPYVWGATNIQKAGKFVADGKFSSTTWDKQIGVAAIIKAMAELEPDAVQITRES